MEKLDSWTAFVAVSIALLVFAFLLNKQVYVMPDALSMAVGSTLASYIAALFVWGILRVIKRENAPKYRPFVTCAATFFILVISLPTIERILE